MTRLVKLMRLAAALAWISSAFTFAAAPITASADYQYTGPTHWYQAGYTQADTHFWESPPGGVGWYSEVIWDSSVYTNWLSTTVQFYGQSDAYWWGTSPWCADGIELTDYWGASGVAISVSTSGVGGSGLEAPPATFRTSNAVCNDSFDRVEHQYSQITLNGFPIYSFNQHSCAVLTFSYLSPERCGPFSWDWVNL